VKEGICGRKHYFALAQSRFLLKNDFTVIDEEPN